MAGMNEKQITKDLYEVSFANHIFEFIRFYNKHKNLCDELSGLKKREGSIEINRSNFILAIKRLNAFCIDFLHYIDDRDQRLIIEEGIANIEKEFLNDERYNKFKKLGNNISNQENTEFELLYFSYLERCFELSYKILPMLQKSLMISTEDIKKTIEYQNTRPFFENLSKYRDEISEDIANFQLVNCFEHYKKMLGYVFTYKILISKKNNEVINSLLKKYFKMITQDKTVGIIIAIKETKKMSEKESNESFTISSWLKYILSKIYFYSNMSLSEKNILPKIKNEVFIDKSAI